MKTVYTEHRALISREECAAIREALRMALPADSCADASGGYLVSNLYFEEPAAGAVRAAAFAQAEPYLIRSYNRDPSQLFLEKKEMHDHHAAKTRVSLPYGEFQKMLAGDYAFLKEQGMDAYKDLYYGMRLRQLRPRRIVEFHRCAFDAGSLRITLDTDIRTGFGAYRMFNSTRLNPSLSDGRCLLSIKYGGVLELHDRQALDMQKSLQACLHGEGLFRLAR